MSSSGRYLQQTGEGVGILHTSNTNNNSVLLCITTIKIFNNDKKIPRSVYELLELIRTTQHTADE